MSRLKPLIVAGLAVCSLCGAVAAENIVSGRSLLDGGAVKLSVEELKSTIRPGVQVETYAPGTGSFRMWTNDDSGKFVASRQGGTGHAQSQGTGQWKVTDSGEYCVVIEWRTAKNMPDYTEKWCRVLYRYDGALYLAPTNLGSKAKNNYSKVQFN